MGIAVIIFFMFLLFDSLVTGVLLDIRVGANFGGRDWIQLTE
jgi:hypothetical protein